MQDLHNAINALKNILNEAPPQGRQDGPGTRQGTTPKPKPAGPAAYNSVGDMMKAIATPGRQGVSDPNQSAKNVAAAQPKPAAKPTLGGTGVGRQDGPGLPKPAAPKINPAVPAAGPVRANPINPQAMAATKAAASVVNAPKPATSMAMPKPKPAAPAPRAKVKATAANTKDFDKTMALQKRLQAQGYDIKADGIMGKNTRAAMAKAAQSARPEPTGTARKVSTVAPGADAAPKEFTPIAGAGDRKIGPTSSEIKIDRGNKALARDFKKVKDAGSGILDKITGGISSLFKAGSNRRAERDAENKASAQAYRAGRNRTATAAAPAAADRIASLPNATTTDRAGNISPDCRPRQPSDAAPTNRFDRAKARMQAARDRKAARGDTTPVSVSDVQNAAAQSRAAVAATAAAPTTRRSDTSFRASDGTNTVARDASGNLNVRQRVTDPDAKAALLSKVNRAREMQRLALAAGSTDPDDIRAYQRRMKNTKGMGAAGGTAPNTF